MIQGSRLKIYPSQEGAIMEITNADERRVVSVVVRMEVNAWYVLKAYYEY